MKYNCVICGDLCFDGTTEKSLRYDVACHEMGETHKGNLKSILGERTYVGW